MIYEAMFAPWKVSLPSSPTASPPIVPSGVQWRTRIPSFTAPCFNNASSQLSNRTKESFLALSRLS